MVKLCLKSGWAKVSQSGSHIKVHKGCRTQADSREGLEVNMREALELYRDEPVGTNLVHPQPASSPPEECVKVPVSPEAALPILLRGCRISRRMS